MKKMAWITGILTCLMALLAALGCVCGAVNQIATDEHFYGGMSRAAVMQDLNVTDDPQVSEQTTAYIGLTSEEQDVFAQEIVRFMTGETDEQPQILNEREQQHMLDVRVIVSSLANMSKTYLTLAAALAVVTAWTGAKLKRRAMPVLAGSLSAVTLIMLVVMNVMNEVAGGGFEQMFVKMHQMLFTNDLWLMDPQTDILIRMMPQPLFEQALLNGANQALRMFLIVWVMLIAVHAVVSGMIRRHVAKGEE